MEFRFIFETMKTDREIREKLIVSGPEKLSDAELLAIFLREGTETLSAAELAENILAEFSKTDAGTATGTGACAKTGAGSGVDTKTGALTALASADVQRIRRTAGCGTTRAVRIAAVGELARRITAEKAQTIDTVTSKDDVVNLFAPIAELGHEEFWALYLTSGGRVLDRVRLSHGGVAGTVVDHKLVVKRAVELLASSLIIVHNHPSGIAAPSGEDDAITQRIRAAAALFDIKIVDHIIVSRSGSYSFAENGKLKNG